MSRHLLSEPAIVCHLAKAVLGNNSGLDWDLYLQNYDHIRAAIERAIPGFDNYNERVREHGGFYLPNGAREGQFHTNNSKANFNVAEVPKQELAPGEYIMMTIRSHDQFNTTIYGLDDRYRGIYHERRVILMNPFDIGQAGLQDGDVVDLFNFSDGVERVAFTRRAHELAVVTFAAVILNECATHFIQFQIEIQ